MGLRAVGHEELLIYVGKHHSVLRCAAAFMFGR